MNSRDICCPICGSKSGAGLRYCRQCGISLETVKRALMLAQETGSAAAREPAGASGRANELAVLLTASLALVVYTVAVFTIGLGLVIAGKLGFALTSIWVVALAGPIFVLSYFWMRRWTRARISSYETPRTDPLRTRSTTRIDFDDAAPTARQISMPKDVADVTSTQPVSETDETKRLPD